MIENYDPNMRNIIHTVRITLMRWDYVGHIAYRVGGNCKGASLLDAESCFECDTLDDINNYVENDCKLAWDEDYEIYTAVFTNANGDKLEIEADPEEIKDMVVAIELINVEKEYDKND